MGSNLLPFFFFFTGVSGIGISILLISSSKQIVKNAYLSVCIVSLALTSIYDFFHLAGISPSLPILFVIANSTTYIVAPASYLYIRNISNPETPIRTFDWLHFIPFVVVLIGLINVSLLIPQVTKLALARNSVNLLVDVSQHNLYRYLALFKIAIWLFYTLQQSRSIISFELKDVVKLPFYNRRLINWVKSFNLTLIMMFSAFLIQHLITTNFINLTFISDIIITITLLTIVLLLLCNPYVLYNLDDVDLNIPGSKINALCKDENDESDISVKPLFNAKKKEQYLITLNDVLNQNKPYLNKRITVKDLSGQMGIPPHHLSSLITNEFNVCFQDFINMRRIEYLKDHIDEMKWKQLTLEGIGWEIGFTSRTTFFRAFIKITGTSPSEYLSSLKKERTSIGAQ